MSAGVSTWWSTPARVDRHFSEDERRASDRYHRPLRRVGLAAHVAKALLLLLSLPVASHLSPRLDNGGFDDRWHLDRGWFEGFAATRVVLGAVLVVGAIRLPATVADAWFEFRFRRGDPEYQPVPVGWFAVTAIALSAGSIAGITVFSGLGYHLAGTRGDWPIVLAAFVVAVFAAAAFWEQFVRRLLPSGEKIAEPESELVTELEAVAARFGLTGLQFGTRAGGAYGDDSAEQAANAYTAGIGRHRRVIMTDALLNLDIGTRDFVVAHELAHVKRHHVPVQSVVNAIAPLLVVFALGAVADATWPWTLTGLNPFDPAGLMIPVLVAAAVSALAGPAVSWLSRAHERSADAGAIAVMGPLPAPQARQMYLAATVDLDPPWWTKVYGQHPSPAERLEFLARSAQQDKGAAALN